MPDYPPVNVYVTNWKITMLLMGKSTISTGPFSIAFCMFTRGYTHYTTIFDGSILISGGSSRFNQNLSVKKDIESLSR